MKLTVFEAQVLKWVRAGEIEYCPNNPNFMGVSWRAEAVVLIGLLVGDLVFVEQPKADGSCLFVLTPAGATVLAAYEQEIAA